MSNTPQIKEVTMEMDDFFDVFKPVKNTLRECDSWDGAMFETYGAELAYVVDFTNKHPHQVWTLVECDGRYSITEGMHYVNRVGYFLTEKAAAPNTFYNIIDPDDDDEDDEDEDTED